MVLSGLDHGRLSARKTSLNPYFCYFIPQKISNRAVLSSHFSRLSKTPSHVLSLAKGAKCILAWVLRLFDLGISNGSVQYQDTSQRWYRVAVGKGTFVLLPRWIWTRESERFALWCFFRRERDLIAKRLWIANGKIDF